MKYRDNFKRQGDTDGHDWAQLARDAIYGVHRQLDPVTNLADRTAAIDAAYPFEVRAHYPYKVWCRERRKYLKPFGYEPQKKPNTPQIRKTRSSR